MLLTCDFLENERLSILASHIPHISLAVFGVPYVYIFEVFYVLPEHVEQYSLEHFVHIVFATFILINVLMNMFYTALTDTSVKGRALQTSAEHGDDWTMCKKCNSMRPPRSFHCRLCKMCILKRDHHCKFLASCIGYYNYRYFLMLTLYITISAFYAGFYNYLYLVTKITWDDEYVVLKAIFPIVCIYLGFNSEALFILEFIVNVCVGLISFALLAYHVFNILHGRTSVESVIARRSKVKQVSFYDQGLLGNLVETLGSRWYLTWICPIIKSPLPGDGIKWSTRNEAKND